MGQVQDKVAFVSGGGSGTDPGPELNEEGVAPPVDVSLETSSAAVRVDWTEV